MNTKQEVREGQWTEWKMSKPNPSMDGYLELIEEKFGETPELSRYEHRSRINTVGTFQLELRHIDGKDNYFFAAAPLDQTNDNYFAVVNMEFDHHSNIGDKLIGSGFDDKKRMISGFRWETLEGEVA